jgi:predicted RNase H-like nuclease (RuvC/YqgF family)
MTSKYYYPHRQQGYFHSCDRDTLFYDNNTNTSRRVNNKHDPIYRDDVRAYTIENEHLKIENNVLKDIVKNLENNVRKTEYSNKQSQTNLKTATEEATKNKQLYQNTLNKCCILEKEVLNSKQVIEDLRNKIKDLQTPVEIHEPDIIIVKKI